MICILTYESKAWYIIQIGDPWEWRSVYRLENPPAGTIPISKDTRWQMRPLYRKVTGSSAMLIMYGATISIPLLITIALALVLPSNIPLNHGSQQTTSQAYLASASLASGQTAVTSSGHIDKYGAFRSSLGKSISAHL